MNAWMPGRERRGGPRRRGVGVAWAGALLLPAVAWAIDPPHATNVCGDCHMEHQALGNVLTSVAGIPNLCISCHAPGTSLLPFAPGDQALVSPGLSTGLTAGGTSHRWDSGPAGHAVFAGGSAIPSTGRLQPLGLYTGAYPKTYTVTIAAGGNAGVATFTWTATTPGGGGSGSSLLTSTNGVLLDSGVSVAFRDGPATTVSFRAGDRWLLPVRTDLTYPTSAVMLARMTNGGDAAANCGTCHDPHSQKRQPFDAAAPAFGGSGTGGGRHFMRVNNDVNQMCVDCHRPRNVTNAVLGSHPVGMGSVSGLYYKAATNLPLQKGTNLVRCLTCHDAHYAVSADGTLLRTTNSLALCRSCHTLENPSSPHFNAADAATLWPGGQYGSLYPRDTNAAERGSCAGCHFPHGWPNATNTALTYEHLLVDFEENLCFTCHDANGPATAESVQPDFLKAVHHRVQDSQQTAGRSVECTDCHNPHRALAESHVFTNTATALRNRVSNPLLNVSGVAVKWTGLGNFVAPGTNLYVPIPASVGATNEYQICFKCHTPYGWPGGTAPRGISPNGTNTTPFETDLAQEFSTNNRSGHPIVTGLTNYPNSTAVGSPARKGLQPAAMKAPWNVNVGLQTMMCSDCHNTDAATPAAQGPHGSAAQFMLRGPNSNNWPNVPVSGFSTSWCANCHNNSAGIGHGGDHTGVRCYVCHIVIPHGGKISRLIADNNSTMPARYAYNGVVSTVGMQQFRKAATGSYTENNNCRTSCGHHSEGVGNEDW